MKMTDCVAVAMAAVLSIAVAETASARSLLYYYDFDTVDESGHISSVENKGAGAAEAAFKRANNGSNSSLVDGEFVWTESGGPFGDSGHAMYTYNSPRSLWLPASEGNLGCSTTNGFTVSMWVNYKANREDWRDFFGFVLGDYRYFLEYPNVTNKIRLYGYGPGKNDVEDLATFTHNSGEWGHLSLVVTPSVTNAAGQINVYVNGNLVTNALLYGRGILKQVQLGATIKGLEDVRNRGSSYTAIDEFALFNYPATAEQIKWLTKHKPGQPTGGPGREMPIAWRFDYTESSKIRTSNSGTGGETPMVWYYGDNAGYTDAWGGALGSQYGYKMTSGVHTTFYSTNLTASAGLGATAGSGFAFSFWLKAPRTVTAWSELFSFIMGNRLFKFEWTSRTWSPPGGGTSQNYFAVYSQKASNAPNLGWTFTNVTNDSATLARDGSEWQHVAISYDTGRKAADVYIGGSLIASSPVREDTYAFSPSESIKSITLGPGVYYPDGTFAYNDTYSTATYVDELAFFNYSISPEEIAWLGSNIPKLPPLSATNLARTVSADCAWAGGLASWSVLDGTGADTGRFSIYPSVEDTETEVAVSIASAATIVNDTFVTPAKLKFTNGTGGASASATISSSANTMFAPENLEVADGVTLTVKPGDVSVAGELKFGEDAKIIFDMKGAGEDEKTVKGLSALSVALPAGDSDLLSHFGVRGSYTVSLSEDGKTVNLNRTNGLLIFVR